MWVRTAPCAMQGQLSALPPLTNTQCYLLSHFKGCFISAKSQSSTDRHDSGLGFTSELSAFTPAHMSRGAGSRLKHKALQKDSSARPEHADGTGHAAATPLRHGGDGGAARSCGAKQCCFLGHLHYGFLMGWHAPASPGSHLLLEPLRNPTLSTGTAAPIQPTPTSPLLFTFLLSL